MDTVLQKHFLHVNILLKAGSIQSKEACSGDSPFRIRHRAILPGCSAIRKVVQIGARLRQSYRLGASCDCRLTWPRCAPVISIRKHLRRCHPPSCVRRLLGFVHTRASLAFPPGSFEHRSGLNFKDFARGWHVRAWGGRISQRVSPVKVV